MRVSDDRYARDIQHIDLAVEHPLWADYCLSRIARAASRTAQRWNFS